MPRFIRGGRGLWRKVQSSNGLFPKANDNQHPNITPSSTPKLDKSFTIIIAALIINAILFFFIGSCVAAGDNDTPIPIIIFVTSVVGIPIVIFVYVIIYFFIGLTKKETQTSTDIQPMQNNNSIDSQKTLLSPTKKEHIKELTVKYLIPISNFARCRHSCNKYGFAYILWRNTGWSFAGNDFYVMEENNPTLRKIITDDWGKRRMEYNRYRGYFHPDTIESSGEELKFLIKSLKEKILSANEWSDFETLDIAIYFIIRNGLLKYFNITYEEQYNYTSIEQLADALVNSLADRRDDNRHARYLYIYHCAYNTNIFTPLEQFYETINNQIDKVCEDIKFKDYEKALYTAQTESTENEQVDCTSLSKEEIDNIAFNSDTYEALNPIEKIDMMTGRQFEEFLAHYFNELGYSTTLTPQSGDYGIDIIIEARFEKIGVQVKCYQGKVTNSAVQEAVAGVRHYGLDKAMVITNNYFQPSAIELARDNGVILWDRDKLIEELK